MSLYFFKPVVWNDQGYQRPGGAKFLSGYPAEHGFGHEEWNNNSDRLEFVENGKPLRIFHTEGFGNQPLSDYSGRIFVFMIASHKGKQYLVASGGRATWLGGDEVERRRDVAGFHQAPCGTRPQGAVPLRSVHFKKTRSIVVITFSASLWLPENVEASTGMSGGL
jgi:hypothetical protein